LYALGFDPGFGCGAGFGMGFGFGCGDGTPGFGLDGVGLEVAVMGRPSLQGDCRTADELR